MTTGRINQVTTFQQVANTRQRGQPPTPFSAIWSFFRYTLRVDDSTAAIQNRSIASQVHATNY